jgi:hypothetical protein
MSDLVMWNNELYTGCDSTGIVYKIGKKLNLIKDKNELIPMYTLTNGNGTKNERQHKIEWMTVQHGKLGIY